MISFPPPPFDRTYPVSWMIDLLWRVLLYLSRAVFTTFSSSQIGKVFVVVGMLVQKRLRTILLLQRI